ncbi:hypothetical protein VMCG_10757 [Cytospora schulzeri]|uniref:Uncharacterized protein n=1 Tax=Cytospora schulzeri TaxID=448051 RepID=A0A423V8U3_9PEZI|nr:hypothetical protein VMCG_10757 [Valsa malicola]
MQQVLVAALAGFSAVTTTCAAPSLEKRASAMTFCNDFDLNGPCSTVLIPAQGNGCVFFYATGFQ